MKRANWKTTKLLNGYIILADSPVENAPKSVHQAYKKLRADVERQVASDRNSFIVGSNPIRDERGFLGWVIIASRVGVFEKRMTNILNGLA